MLSNIPVGWRLYNIDASIEDRYSVWFTLTKERKTKYLALDESLSERLSLYTVGCNSDIKNAFDEAAKEAIIADELLKKFNI